MSRMTTPFVALTTGLSRAGWTITTLRSGSSPTIDRDHTILCGSARKLGASQLALRSDEGVQERDRVLPVDRDVLSVGARPADTEGITTLTEEILDVLGQVGEHVAGGVAGVVSLALLGAGRRAQPVVQGAGEGGGR